MRHYARRCARLFAFLILSSALLAPQAAAPVAAHAELSAATPAPGAFLAVAPTAVRLTFTSALQLDGSSIAVIAPGGVEVNVGPTQLDASRRVLSTALRPDLANGLYTVIWVAVATDGDEEEGSFDFGLRVGSAPPVVQLDRRAADLGQTVTLTGTGFKPRGSVAIAIGANEQFLELASADAEGRIRQAIQIPSDASFGPQPITAADGDGATATISLLVTSGGASQLTSYAAARAGARTCSAWSPLFARSADGWNSTMVLRNQGSSAVTVDFRMRAIPGGGLLTRSLSVPQFATRQITGADLGLPEGFRGSIAATANPCGAISAVTHHSSETGNLVALESVEEANTTVMIPLVYNDHNGWTSQVAVQNTSRDNDATVLVTFRGTDLPEAEASVTVRRDSSLLLDLSSAPKGALTVEVENKAGAQGLVAAAYHVGPLGLGQANNGVAQSQGSRRVFLPLLYRNYNGYASALRVVNVTEGGAQPKITLYDRDTGERAGTFTGPRTLREGDETTFELTAIPFLSDQRIYTATVEVEPGGGDALAAIAMHTNARRGANAVNAAAPRGDTAFTAPIVYRAASGLNSSVQIQNLTSSSGSATVRFKNAAGTTVAAATITVFGNSAATVYLPSVSNLPDGFVGFAEIATSVPTTVLVLTSRYS